MMIGMPRPRKVMIGNPGKTDVVSTLDRETRAFPV